MQDVHRCRRDRQDKEYIMEFWKNFNAGKGYQWVLTEKGFATTPKDVRRERKVGSPVKGFERCVPGSWVINGWVREEAISEQTIIKKCYEVD